MCKQAKQPKLYLWKRFRRFWHCLWYTGRQVYGAVELPGRPGETLYVKGQILIGTHSAWTFWNEKETIIMCGCGKEF